MKKKAFKMLNFCKPFILCGICNKILKHIIKYFALTLRHLHLANTDVIYGSSADYLGQLRPGGKMSEFFSSSLLLTPFNNEKET